MNFLSPILRAFVFLLPLQFLDYLIPAPSEFRFPGKTLNMKRFVSRGWTLHARCCAVLRTGQALQYRQSSVSTHRPPEFLNTSTTPATLQNKAGKTNNPPLKQLPHFTVAEDLQLFNLTQAWAASHGAAARASRFHHLHEPARALVRLRRARAQQCPAGNQPKKQRWCSLPGSFVKSCRSSSTAGHRPQESRGPPPAAGLSGAAGVWTSAPGEKQAQKRAPEVQNHHCFSNHLCISEQNLCQL